MNPKVWGPHAWFFLHSVTLAYPDTPSETDKKQMYDFFMSLSNILPCTDCMKHFKQHLNKYPITPFLDSKDSLVSWLIILHNMVNVSNGKPTMTNKQVLDYYNKQYKYGASTPLNKIFSKWSIISSTVLLLILALIYHKEIINILKKFTKSSDEPIQIFKTLNV